jgi:hypothetical protein
MAIRLPPLQESRAWQDASDEDWAAYAGTVFAAAEERREHDER